MPTITDFKTSLTNTLAPATQIVAAMLCAGYSGYAGFTMPQFTGNNNAAEKDPGGLYGWLCVDRTIRGYSAPSYFSYTNSNTLVTSLNRLSGVTYCLVSSPTQGGTYGFFLNDSTSISPKNFAGTDLLYALNYLAYGGQLIIAGKTAGLAEYNLNNPDAQINVLIGTTFNSDIATWLRDNPYIIGMIPSQPDTSGQVGASYGLMNYGILNNASLLQAGSTFSTRMFNVYGVKKIDTFFTDNLVANTRCPGYYLSAVADVAGFYQSAYDSNTVFTTIAGYLNGQVLNGSIINSVAGTDKASKTTLRNNRVNYFINGQEIFLGQDLTGATTSSADALPIERIGTTSLKLQIEKTVTDIVLQYLFKVNVALTRSQVVTEVQAYLNTLSAFIDPAYTVIQCDDVNNTDYSTTLTVSVSVKPLLSSDTLSINVSIVN